jgi:ketosteroid isomerase-like protein
MTASENLDLVRSIYADWERGDFSHVEWADPEIEYVMVGGPAPGRWTGWAEMAQSEREFLRTFEGYRIEAEGYRELDGGRVFVLARSFGRGKASGLDIEQLRAKTATLFHVRAGKVTRLVGYFERDRALADLGLAE